MNSRILHRRAWRRWLMAGVVFLGAAISNAADDELAGLRKGHPRLLATASEWTRLHQRIERDPLLAQVNAAVIADAQALLGEPPLVRTMTGRRLLGVSRSLVQRVLALAYAWQVTSDSVFARRAEAEMLAAADFSDWNPSHFLDVGEAATAVAIGYDWCHEALAPAAKATIRRALVEKALRPGLDAEASHNSWHRAQNNWNQVCFGGLTLAALAIAENEPALARQTLAQARAGIVHGLVPYAPDGVYPEGPAYWAYGTTYQVLMIAALDSALGTDWNLPASRGFMPSVGAFLHTTAPSGDFFNFADGGERGLHEPAVYWFARELGDPGLLLFNQRKLRGGELELAGDARSRFFALSPLWWPETAADELAPKLPTKWVGDGPNPIGVFRESWTEPRAMYLAFKGGAAELNHAHMDAGSFVFERDGVRWAIDLGAQSYESLESKGIDLWNRRQNSQRWQVYRLNHDSHNTLTIDGRPHRVDGNARIVAFSSDDAEPRAVVDLTPVFGGEAQRVQRGFRWLPGRRVLIQDEFTGLRPGAEVRWQMLTRAAVELDDAAAVLRQEGESLRIQFLMTEADDAQVAVAAAEPPADGFNAPNPGVRVLRATRRAPADGALRFAVILGDDASAATSTLLIPLEGWRTR